MLGNTCTQQIANNLPFITISQLQGGSEIFIAKHNIFDNHDNLKFFLSVILHFLNRIKTIFYFFS